MILNVTNEPFENFSCMQRLALKGETLLCVPVETIEDFAEAYDGLNNVNAVIIDRCNFILANDIINYVSCRVVTLQVESIEDITNCNFVEYD